MNGNFSICDLRLTAAQKSNVVGDVKQSTAQRQKNQFKFIVLFHSIGNRTFLDGINTWHSKFNYNRAELSPMDFLSKAVPMPKSRA
jgi:hypothetical protein